MSSDDAAELLDPILDGMIKSVHEYGGRVISSDGDGIMAVFGAEGNQEHHAVRAVLAGQGTLKTNKKNLRKPDIRIGLHSGYVIVRWQDTYFGGSLDLIGNTAHLCAKVESAGKPNLVTISGETNSLVEEFFNTKKQNSSIYDIELYEILGNTLPRLAEIKFKTKAKLPFVERDRELDAILEKINPSSGGKAYIGIIADAGMGKTRLLSELYNRLTRRNILTIVCDSTSIYSDSPFFCIGAFIKKIMNLHSDLAARTMRIMRSGEHRELKLGFELLLYSDIREELMEEIQPEDCMRFIKLSLVFIFERLLQHDDLVLCVEDVHFTDSESLLCLEHIADYFQPSMLSIIFSSRPEGRDFVEKVAKNIISLKPLSKLGAQTLISWAADYDINKFEEMRDLIIKRSEGLPLALIEFGKSFNPSKDYNVNLPISLEPLLRRKFDNLDPRESDLVDMLTVFGARTSKDFIREALEWDEEVFEDILLALQSAGIINISGLNLLEFSHHLFLEVSSQAIPRKISSQLHKRAYDTLVVNSKAIDSQVLAFHAEKSGEFSLALSHLFIATKRAIALIALETVRSLYFRIEKICDLIGTQEAYLKKLNAASMAFLAFQQLSREKELLPIFEEALTKNLSLSSMQRTSLLCNLGSIKFFSGSSETYEQAVLAMNSALKEDNKGIIARASFVLANAEFASGKPKSAAHRLANILESDLNIFSKAKDPSSIFIRAAQLRIHSSWYHYEVGEHDTALRLFREANEIAIENDHIHSNLICDLNRGYFAYREGRFEEAATALCPIYDKCIENSHYGFAPLVAAWSVMALTELEDVESAEEILNKELQLNKAYLRRQNGWLYYIKQAQSSLARLKGNKHESELYLKEGLEHCQKIRDQVHEAYGHFESAKLFIKNSRKTVDIDFHFNEAKRLATLCEMEPLLKTLESVT